MENINKSSNKLLSGTMIILAITVLAKFAAFITDAVLAAYMGTGFESDAYYMVSGVQQVIFPMLSVGIWRVFLPIYKSKMTEGDIDGANRIANKSTTFFTLVSLCVIALLLLFSSAVVSIIAPGFDKTTHDLSAKLVMIAAPKYLLIVASGIYAAMLQCHGKFFASQIREVASYIPTILAAVLFYKRFGVYSLAISLVVGSMLRLLIELPFVDWKYHYRPDFRFKEESFIILLKRLPSAMLSEGVTLINTLVDKAMASSLPSGSVTGLTYGAKLVHVFNGLLSSSVTIAFFPQMIEMATLGKKEELKQTVTKIFNIFAVLMVPVTVACIVYSRQIVTLVFKRGEFTEESVLMTAGTFACYSIGLFFDACSSVVRNIFYSYGDTRTPLYISIISLGINVVLNFVLIKLLGINGLALATSLSAVITLILRVVWVRKHIRLAIKRSLVLILKLIAIAGVSIVAVGYALRIVVENPYLNLAIGAVAGGLLYLGGLMLFRIRELKDIVDLLKNKLKKKKA